MKTLKILLILFISIHLNYLEAKSIEEINVENIAYQELHIEIKSLDYITIHNINNQDIINVKSNHKLVVPEHTIILNPCALLGSVVMHTLLNHGQDENVAIIAGQIAESKCLKQLTKAEETETN